MMRSAAGDGRVVEVNEVRSGQRQDDGDDRQCAGGYGGLHPELKPGEPDHDTTPNPNDGSIRYAQRSGYTLAEQQGREQLRLQAAGRFARGDGINEIAHDLRVTPGSVRRWRRAWQDGGAEALRSGGPVSREKLSLQQWARLGQELRGVAAGKAWRATVCFEDEAGQGLRPPKGRTWAPRGARPVVRVRGAGGGRVSIAGVVCST